MAFINKSLVLVLSMFLAMASAFPTQQANTGSTNSPSSGQIVIVKNNEEMNLKYPGFVPQYLTSPVDPAIFNSQNTTTVSRSRRDLTPFCPIEWYVHYNAYRYPQYIWMGKCNGAGTTCTLSGIPSCTEHRVTVNVWFLIGYTQDGYLIYQCGSENVITSCSCSS